MAKHDPTRQHKEMYHELNTGGTGHTTPHKDLNAAAPAELNKHPIGYSALVDGVNFKSPVQIKQIDGFKSQTHDMDRKSFTQDTPNTASGFSESQIPNTKPKSLHTSATGHPIVTHHHKSKSLIFHG